MRIIRIVLVLLAAIAFMLPYMTLASETPTSDTNIKNKISLFSSPLLINTAYADEGIIKAEPAKTEEEIKNENIINKWKEKQAVKWNNLPKYSFTINASAYTASADECGNDKGITASGIKAQAERTIACPPEFPFGAKIEIVGVGTFVCEDRGGAIKGNHIDIFVQTKAEAFKFGRQNLTARVIEG